MQLGEPLRPDDLDRHADELGHRGTLRELLEPVVLVARRTLPHAWKSTAWPVSASSRW